MTPAERAAALAQASMPTLLMSLAQITGDRRWLEIAVRRSGQPTFTTLLA